MRYGFLMVLFGIGILSACATTPDSMTVTCSTIGSSPLTSPGNRINMNHFSVQLPDDAERWCSGGLGTGHLVLYTHPLMGQYVEKPERQMALNTVALMAMELDHGSTPFETTKALQSFVEDWIDRGFGVEGTGSDIKVMHSRVPSFTVRRFNVTPDPKPQAHCVRYEYQMKERDNPSAPDKVLVLDVYGLVCQHPRISSNIVSMGLSERYPEGAQINPVLYTQLKRAVALPFFDSLQF